MRQWTCSGPAVASGGTHPEPPTMIPRVLVPSFVFVLILCIAPAAAQPWTQYDDPADAGWDLARLATARSLAESIGSAAVMIVDDGVVVAPRRRAPPQHGGHVVVDGERHERRLAAPLRPARPRPARQARDHRRARRPARPRRRRPP